MHFRSFDERQVRTRRLNGRGYVKLFGRQHAVGQQYAGRVVTVLLEDSVATVLDGDLVLRRILLLPSDERKTRS